MKDKVLPTLVAVNPSVRVRLSALTDDAVATGVQGADLAAIVDGMTNMLARGLSRAKIAAHYGCTVPMVIIVERGYKKRIEALRKEYLECIETIEEILDRETEDPDSVVQSVEDGIAQLLALIGDSGTRKSIKK